MLVSSCLGRVGGHGGVDLALLRLEGGRGVVVSSRLGRGAWDERAGMEPCLGRGELAGGLGANLEGGVLQVGEELDFFGRQVRVPDVDDQNDPGRGKVIVPGLMLEAVVE